jgi:hypothetical protein
MLHLVSTGCYITEYSRLRMNEQPLDSLLMCVHFPHQSRPVLGSIQPPVQWVPDLFLGGKATGEWRWPPQHPPPPKSSAVAKQRVEMYPYSPSGFLWPLLGYTLPFFYPFLYKVYQEYNARWEADYKIFGVYSFFKWATSVTSAVSRQTDISLSTARASPNNIRQA